MILTKKYFFHSQNGLIAKMIMECISCMIFHFVGSIANNAEANAIVLMVLVYYAAKISGAHLNPAITLTFTALGHVNPLEMFAYWSAQIIGCILGALWIACLVPGLTFGSDIVGYKEHGCFVSRMESKYIFGWEALSTFNFILPIFAVVWYTQTKSGYGNTGPIIVGLSLYANALVCGKWTGAALNPARVLGSPAVFNCGNKSQLFYYIIGELFGALVACLAIIPWYGISATAWYKCRLPKAFHDRVVQVEPFKWEHVKSLPRTTKTTFPELHSYLKTLVIIPEANSEKDNNVEKQDNML